MTETQIPTDHRAPLAPGEIRSWIVDGQHFQVMHSGGGMFTQAKVITADGSRVLKTSRWGHETIDAYADAIEQAERDATANDAVAFNLPMGADMTLVTGEGQLSPAVIVDIEAERAEIRQLESGKSLAELINAYGAAIARGAIVLTGGAFRGDEPTGVAVELRGHTERADALKAEILARFGQ